MRKSINRLLLLTTLPLLLTACDSEWMLEQTKGRYLRQFERFVDEVEAESPTYASDAEWEAVEERFVELADVQYERYRPVLTPEERRRVKRLQGRYLALQVKYLGRRGSEELRDTIEAGKEFLRELKE